MTSAGWATSAIFVEKERREREDLSRLGPRPSWWRPRARRSYDRTVTRLKKAHADDLRLMLATQDSQQREILAHLIGWKLPTEER